MGGLRPVVRVYIAALVTLALGAVLAPAAGPLPAGRGDLLLAAALSAAVGLAWLHPLHFAFKTKLYVSAAPAFAAVLLFSPRTAALTAALGVLLAHLARPAARDAAQAAFNTAQVALQALVGGGLLAAVGWDPAAPPFDDPLRLAAAAGAGAVMWLIAAGAVGAVAGLQAALPPRVWYAQEPEELRVDLATYVAQLGLGLAAALLSRDHPWGAVLLVPPVVAIFTMLRHHVRLRLRAEEALRGTEASLAAAQRIARLGSWDWDLATGRQLWSDETYRVLGFEPQTFAPTHDLYLGCVHPTDRPRVEAAIRQALAGGAPYSVDHRVVRPDGTERTVHAQGEVLTDAGATRVVGTVHDVTERKALEAQLAHRAFHDPLTDLPNRALFTDRLEAALAGQNRPGRARGLVAVAFLDLDGFKGVNDGLGHDAGDRLLVEVAARLRGALRPGDTAARFGGDEFVVLLQRLGDPGEAVAVAERIGEALRRPFVLGGREAAVSASVGIAWGRAGGASALALLRDADAALYHAKAAGKDRCVVFEPRMGAGAAHRLGLRGALRRAVERDELRLLYQPQVDLATGRVLGFEALVRWQHPEHGLVPPAGFLPLAEESGLIVPLGEWVLGEACRQAAAWQRRHPGGSPVRVAVNLSVRQLQGEGLAEAVAAALRATGLEPGRLELEVTEHVLAEDPAAVAATLRALRALGVRISLDDFGTGYSSLAYLRDLEVDALKLDQSFVAAMADDPRAQAIARSVAGLAAGFGMTATAEGIETTEHLLRARAAGCGVGQGYFFAEALPAAAAGDLLARAVPYDVLANVRPVPLPAPSPRPGPAAAAAGAG